jgi:hypothetical protein
MLSGSPTFFATRVRDHALAEFYRSSCTAVDEKSFGLAKIGRAHQSLLMPAQPIFQSVGDWHPIVNSRLRVACESISPQFTT